MRHGVRWFEVWFYEPGGAEYLLMLRERNGMIELVDPQKGGRIVDTFDDYDEARHTLSEDDYAPVGERLYYDKDEIFAEPLSKLAALERSLPRAPEVAHLTAEQHARLREAGGEISHAVLYGPLDRERYRALAREVAGLVRGDLLKRIVMLGSVPSEWLDGIELDEGT